MSQASFKIAIRTEGNRINAYFAIGDVIDPELLMGSIARMPCQDNPELYQAWEALMTLMLESMISMFGAKVASYTRIEQ